MPDAEKLVTSYHNSRASLVEELSKAHPRLKPNYAEAIASLDTAYDLGSQFSRYIVDWMTETQRRYEEGSKNVDQKLDVMITEVGVIPTSLDLSEEQIAQLAHSTRTHLTAVMAAIEMNIPIHDRTMKAAALMFESTTETMTKLFRMENSDFAWEVSAVFAKLLLGLFPGTGVMSAIHDLMKLCKVRQNRIKSANSLLEDLDKQIQAIRAWTILVAATLVKLKLNADNPNVKLEIDASCLKEAEVLIDKTISDRSQTRLKSEHSLS